jgi:hypothetical protein
MRGLWQLDLVSMDRGARVMIAQGKYIVWRIPARAPSPHPVKGPGRGKKGVKSPAEVRVTLPDDDPGQDIADRWRKDLCDKVEKEGLARHPRYA